MRHFLDATDAYYDAAAAADIAAAAAAGLRLLSATMIHYFRRCRDA